MEKSNEEPRDSLMEYFEPEAYAEEKQADMKKGKKTDQLSDVLWTILPARKYMAPGGQKMQQKVSTAVSTREDVINLQMKLDERLQERQARENGICPVREELYAQCFDENSDKLLLSNRLEGYFYFVCVMRYAWQLQRTRLYMQAA